MTNDTTAAPASAADAATLARVEAATSVLSITDYDIYLGRAFGNIRASSLAAIAAAAVRLVVSLSDPNPADDEPWWWSRADDGCLSCCANALHWTTVQHYDDCAAVQLDAAIRAAGEATQ